MSSISQLEQDLTKSLKERDLVAANTLRGLKARLHNEQIAKGRELKDEEAVAIIRSELKRRHEAAEAFEKGGRGEQAAKEKIEAEVLKKYLPAQMDEAEVAKAVDQVIAENNFAAADFGKAMGALKQKLGNAADGATLSKILKEKLK